MIEEVDRDEKASNEILFMGQYTLIYFSTSYSHLYYHTSAQCSSPISYVPEQHLLWFLMLKFSLVVIVGIVYSQIYSNKQFADFHGSYTFAYEVELPPPHEFDDEELNTATTIEDLR